MYDMLSVLIYMFARILSEAEKNAPNVTAVVRKNLIREIFNFESLIRTPKSQISRILKKKKKHYSK